MNKKRNYEAPEVELMVIRFEQNIMSQKSSTAPDMTPHGADEWGSWE